MKKNGHLFFDNYADFKCYCGNYSVIDRGISSRYDGYRFYIVNCSGVYLLDSCIYIVPEVKQISF